MEIFFSCFVIFLAVMDLSCVIPHCVIVLIQAHRGKERRGGKVYKKITPVSQNHVLHGHTKELNIYLEFQELRKTLHPDDASDISTDDGIRKRRKSNKFSVGGRFSYHLLTCHTYGDNHPKQREFEGNFIALMSHEFTSLLLVNHEFFRKLTQDLDPWLRSVGGSKLLRSLIPAENKSLGRSMIESLAQANAILISYNLWMSRKTEEFSSLRRDTAPVPIEIALTLGFCTPLLLMMFPCLSLLWRQRKILA